MGPEYWRTQSSNSIALGLQRLARRIVYMNPRLRSEFLMEAAERLVEYRQAERGGALNPRSAEMRTAVRSLARFVSDVQSGESALQYQTFLRSREWSALWSRIDRVIEAYNSEIGDDDGDGE